MSQEQFRPKKRRPKDFVKPNKKRSNPLFERQRQPSSLWPRVNKVLYGIIACVIIYLIVYSPLLHVTAIRYVGPDEFDTVVIENVITAQYSQQLLRLLPQHNILFFDTKAIEVAFEDHPFLDTMRVAKKFPKQLDVFYQLRQPSAIIYNRDLYWSVDSAGFVLSSLDTKDSIEDAIIIFDQFAVYSVTDQIRFSEQLEAMQLIWGRVKQQYATEGIEPTEFIVTQKHSDIQLKTNEGWAILFNLDDDVERQLLVLEQVIHDKIPNRNNLEYIDLRVEDWVYYK